MLRWVNSYINLTLSRGVLLIKVDSVVAVFFKKMNPSNKYRRVGKNTTNVKFRQRGARAGQPVNAYAYAAPRAAPIYRAVTYRAPARAGELKGCDVNVAAQITGVLPSSVFTNLGSCVLNCIQPGAGSWQRVGKRVQFKSLRLRGGFSAICLNNALPNTNSTRSVQVRMVVVYDATPSGGAIPSWDTMFGHTTQLGTESSLLSDGLRYDNVGRFKVISDSMFIFTPPEVPMSNVGIVLKEKFDIFVKMDKYSTIYGGQSNPCTIADIASGAIYLIAKISDDTPNSAAEFLTNTVARLRYVD